MKRDKSNNFYVNRHSSFLLQYHLVLVTKYRKPAITGELREFLLNYAQNYFNEQDCVILEINACEDHIHILFEAPPQINLANFVNAFKSASSRRVRSIYSEQLKRFYWEPLFWSLSYFIATVSERSAAIVQEYIKNQND